MFEHRTKPLLSPARFALRISRHFVAALAVVLGSLWIGVLGYHEFEGMDTTDAFLNAAMILSGMGPVQPLQTEASCSPVATRFTAAWCSLPWPARWCCRSCTGCCTTFIWTIPEKKARIDRAVLSALAAVQAPVIMMRQNRQEARDQPPAFAPMGKIA